MADKDSGGGASPMKGFIGVAIILTLFFMWINNGGPARAKKEGFFKMDMPTVSLPKSPARSDKSDIDQQTSGSPSEDDVDSARAGETKSPHKGFVQLAVGSGRSQYQPNREYIVISARGNKKPINIGGWTLKNGRSNKNYVVSGNTVRGQSVSVKIPSYGYTLYHPFDANQGRKGMISLNSGDKAFIVTGSMPSVAGIKVFDNFKTNRCLGYLEDKSYYNFVPDLSYECPSPREVTGISTLDDACYKFVRSLRSCHKPEDVYIKDQGYCLDRNCKINSTCRNFVISNFNFQSCFDTYSRDRDFVDNDWRIYLGRTWELWEDNRETIYLYDQAGRLVDELSY